MTVRLDIRYTNGAGFSVEAEDEDQLEVLSTYAQSILWPKSKDNAMTLEQARKWLGWE